MTKGTYCTYKLVSFTSGCNTGPKKKWRFIGDAEGIHWEDLDEDILVEGLL
jgi:hypothetical protein